MRIIAGKYGGRKLVSFRADHIRPTTDRVKEAIFNKLQFDLEGARVLDLFSGTGNLAIEALSRGAEFVEAVEMSSKSIAIINKNKQSLKIGDELHVVQSDVIKYLKNSQKKFDVILVDPPFTKKMADEVMQSLGNFSGMEEGASLFIESSAQEKIDDSYGSCQLLKRKSYGDKLLSHFEVSSLDVSVK